MVAERPEQDRPGSSGCGMADADTDSDAFLTAPIIAPATAAGGSPCDDGNANTTGDALTDLCVCIGPPGERRMLRRATAVRGSSLPGDWAERTAHRWRQNSTATPGRSGTRFATSMVSLERALWYVFSSGDQ